MVIETRKTAAGVLKVSEDSEMRCLYVNGALESAMYLTGDQNEPVFPYIGAMLDWCHAHPSLQKIMIIGSGGFQLARGLFDKEVYCFEISHDMIEVSEKYFGLDTLKKREGFHLYETDGFAWLKGQDEKFDVIINDAFQGKHPIGLGADEMRLVKVHLKQGGVYLINAVTAPRGPFSKRRKLTAALHESFGEVNWMLVEEDCSLYEVQNCLVIAGY